jgi:hypothetical protein
MLSVLEQLAAQFAGAVPEERKLPERIVLRRSDFVAGSVLVCLPHLRR